MEIDGQQKLQVEASTAVPEGFNADYLRVYYGKEIRPLSHFVRRMEKREDKLNPVSITICFL